MRQILVMAAVGLAAVSVSAETALWNYMDGSEEAGPWPIYAATQTAPETLRLELAVDAARAAEEPQAVLALSDGESARLTLTLAKGAGGEAAPEGYTVTAVGDDGAALASCVYTDPAAPIVLAYTQTADGGSFGLRAGEGEAVTFTDEPLTALTVSAAGAPLFGAVEYGALYGELPYLWEYGEGHAQSGLGSYKVYGSSDAMPEVLQLNIRLDLSCVTDTAAGTVVKFGQWAGGNTFLKAQKGDAGYTVGIYGGETVFATDAVTDAVQEYRLIYARRKAGGYKLNFLKGDVSLGTSTAPTMNGLSVMTQESGTAIPNAAALTALDISDAVAYTWFYGEGHERNGAGEWAFFDKAATDAGNNPGSASVRILLDLAKAGESLTAEAQQVLKLGQWSGNNTFLKAAKNAKGAYIYEFSNNGGIFAVAALDKPTAQVDVVYAGASNGYAVSLYVDGSEIGAYTAGNMNGLSLIVESGYPLRAAAAEVAIGEGQAVTRETKTLATLTPAERRILERVAATRPTPQQAAWQRMELTAFVHFGVNTYTDQEWGDGSEDPDIFNPTGLDCGQWAKALRAAGFKLAILTAKHHDGFCLWPSDTTDHDVASSSWRGGQGDVVREFVDAMRANGLKVGLYLSPWDRHEPSYGDNSPGDYDDFFVAQLTELLTRYGTIDEMWFDGAVAASDPQTYDWDRYYATIRELMPDCLIAVSGPDIRWVGNEGGMARENEWSVVPASAFNNDAIRDAFNDFHYEDVDPGTMTEPSANSQSPTLGSLDEVVRFGETIWYPAECDVSIRPGWFYHDSQSPKTLEQLMNIYRSSVGRNAVLLLNVPPNREGLFADADVLRLEEFGREIRETFTINRLGAFDPDDPAVNVAEGVYERLLDEPVTFDTFDIRENIDLGQLVESFRVEARDPGTGVWSKIASAGNIGNRRIIALGRDVTADGVRVVIEGTRADPHIQSFGVYKKTSPLPGFSLRLH